MTWSLFLSSAAVAGVISGIVSLIGLLINRATTLSTHSQRLAFEREQEERRFVREVGVTEAKIRADSALAQRKLDLDRAFEAWKRKTEFAEQLLTDFYEAKEIVEGARFPGRWSNEGATRPREAWESEADSALLDSYFSTTERLTNKGEFFSRLFARRYRCMALFGREAAAPFDELQKIRNEVLVAVRMLITTHRNQTEGSLPRDRGMWEAKIGWGLTDTDPIAVRLDAAINVIEAIFRPAIELVET